MSFLNLDAILSFVAILSGVSLLVTTLTQAVSSLLGMRGSGLRKGIASLLQELDPDLREHARTIAGQVLHHPLISDSAFSRSGARLFARWKLASAIRCDELVDILHLLAPPAAEGAPGETPAPWQTALRASLDRFDREAAERMAAEVRGRRGGAPEEAPPTEDILARMLRDAESLTLGIRRWFDSAMDRTSQRFVLHTRFWTVIFSFAVAFALHLDTLQLLTRLSSDAALRGRIAAKADLIAAKADEAAGTAGRPEGGAAETAPSAPLDRSLDETRQVIGLFEKDLGLHLVPDPYPHPFYEYWKPSWLHLLGILASGALLSLGAPFWFNVLKSLCNLKPVVATRAQAEQTSDPGASKAAG
jgi:hypothetical protein